MGALQNRKKPPAEPILRLAETGKSCGFAPMARNLGRRLRPKSRFFQRARLQNESFAGAPFGQEERSVSDK
jgi:hypothetical protein